MLCQKSTNIIKPSKLRLVKCKLGFAFNAVIFIFKPPPPQIILHFILYGLIGPGEGNQEAGCSGVPRYRWAQLLFF